MSGARGEEEARPGEFNRRWAIFFGLLVALMAVAWFRFLAPMAKNRALVDLVENRLGGSVQFHDDELLRIGPIIVDDPARKAKYITLEGEDPDIVGTDWEDLARGRLDRLEGLTIRDRRIGDEGLRRVCAMNLSSLHQLNLHNCELSDAALAELANLPSLRRVSLGNNDITDEGARVLAKIRGLQWLHLGYTRIGDSGLEALSGVSEINSLDLRETDVTGAMVKKFFDRATAVHAFWGSAEGFGDEAIESIVRHGATLTELTLNDSDITDEGLQRLAAGLPKLRMLDLRGSRITDASLPALAVLPDLVYVDVSETEIGDGILELVDKLPKLEMLWVRDTHVSPEAIAQIKANPRVPKILFVH